RGATRSPRAGSRGSARPCPGRPAGSAPGRCAPSAGPPATAPAVSARSPARCAGPPPPRRTSAASGPAPARGTPAAAAPRRRAAQLRQLVPDQRVTGDGYHLASSSKGWIGLATFGAGRDLMIAAARATSSRVVILMLLRSLVTR